MATPPVPLEISSLDPRLQRPLPDFYKPKQSSLLRYSPFRSCGFAIDQVPKCPPDRVSSLAIAILASAHVPDLVELASSGLLAVGY